MGWEHNGLVAVHIWEDFNAADSVTWPGRSRHTGCGNHVVDSASGLALYPERDDGVFCRDACWTGA